MHVSLRMTSAIQVLLNKSQVFLLEWSNQAASRKLRSIC